MASNKNSDKKVQNCSENKLDKSVPCPVCDRVYREQEIEQHVNKCIFLNTSTEENSKRISSQLEGISTPPKKIKLEKDLNITNSNSLSSSTELKMNKNVPLAECMRPNALEDIVGQLDSFGPNTILYSMLNNKKIPNMILWGPPGCGKTSIANVVANICKQENNLRFVKLSATMCGINEVKEVVKVAKNEAQFKRQTVLFMDEIHRFNKLQQDTFLPHVETGTITLLGATTENPSFSLNNALLSRCRVVVLSKLSEADVVTILEKAVVNNDLAAIVDNGDVPKIGQSKYKYAIERSSLQWLAGVCDGDARVALGALELALAAPPPPSPAAQGGGGIAVIRADDLKNNIKRTHVLYDRQGEEHYNVVSAVHKAVRAGDDSAALYWTVRALRGGEDPLYLARRLVRAAAEDVGLADPSAMVEAVACLQGCLHIGAPECDVLLAQCAVRLARCRKSREVYDAMNRVKSCLAEGPLPPVPLHLCNAPTSLMKQLGYGHGYNMLPKNKSGLTYMPKGLENVNFFRDDVG